MHLFWTGVIHIKGYWILKRCLAVREGFIERCPAMTFKYDSPISLNQQPPRGRILSFPWERCFCFCKYLILIILLLTQALINPLNAEWGRTANDYIRLPLYRDAHICSDGNGGCWATGQGVGLSHVDRNGNLTWGMEPFFFNPDQAIIPDLCWLITAM